jgi:hypothetical protein
VVSLFQTTPLPCVVGSALPLECTCQVAQEEATAVLQKPLIMLQQEEVLVLMFLFGKNEREEEHCASDAHHSIEYHAFCMPFNECKKTVDNFLIALDCHLNYWMSCSLS